MGFLLLIVVIVTDVCSLLLIKGPLSFMYAS